MENKRKEKLADYFLDLAKIILASLVLGAMISNDNLDKSRLIIVGSLIFILLTFFGFIFQPRKNTDE